MDFKFGESLGILNKKHGSTLLFPNEYENWPGIIEKPVGNVPKHGIFWPFACISL